MSSTGTVSGARRSRTTSDSPWTTRISWTAWLTPDGLVAAGLLVLLAIVPAAAGSESLSSQAFNTVVAAALVLAIEGLLIARRSGHPVAPSRFVLPGLMALAGLSWTIAQSTSVLPGSFAHPAWQMASEAIGLPQQGRVSVDPDLTAQGALRLVAAGLVFWVACQLAASPARAYALLSGLVAIEVGYGIYGLVTNAIVLRPGTASVDVSISSTFANRNTYATYVGLGCLVALALAWRGLRHALQGAGSSGRLAAASLISGLGGKGMLRAGATLILLACLMLSASRGGVLATLAGAAVLAVLTLARQRRSETGGKAATFLVLFGGFLIVLLALVVFGDLLLGRLSESGLRDQGRGYIYATTLDAILASPWFGYGYGTFASVYPMFNDGTGDAFVTWDLAHNTYLEILLGSGIPAGLLLIGAVVLPAVACFGGALRRERDATLPALAAAASALVGLHAFVDFSLQYQGVALTYAVILGVGFAQARSPRHEGARRLSPQPLRQPAKVEV